jgi:hypothetical protein
VAESQAMKPMLKGTGTPSPSVAVSAHQTLFFCYGVIVEVAATLRAGFGLLFCFCGYSRVIFEPLLVLSPTTQRQETPTMAGKSSRVVGEKHQQQRQTFGILINYVLNLNRRNAKPALRQAPDVSCQAMTTLKLKITSENLRDQLQKYTQSIEICKPTVRGFSF